MTEASGPQESGGPRPTTVSHPMSPQQEPSTGSVPEEHPDTTAGHPCPNGGTPDGDKETMPPPPSRPLQRRDTDRLYREELKEIYDIHANTPLCGLVAAPWRRLQDINPNSLFAPVLVPHAGSTNISVRQLVALVTPGMQLADDLVDAWIWWFNFNKPDQEHVWVPHLGWVHTHIAPPTEPRPAPSTGGRELAARQPRANAPNIPPYNGLAGQKSRSAPDRGRNLRDMVEGYPPGAETAPAGLPGREDEARTISMIVLECGHYHQVWITRDPQECQWNLEAFDSMHPASAALPDGPNPLPQNQPPDPLTAVVSGEAGSWHPGHALYRLWRSVQRRCSHTKEWSATWRFHLDGREQLEAIPQRERTTESPCYRKPVPRLSNPPDPGTGAGRTTAAHHRH